VCRELFLNIPEARIAAGIASATFLPPGASQQNEESGGQPIRRLLVGADPKNPKDPINPEVMVPGFGARPTVDVLADLMVWLAQHPGENPRLALAMLVVSSANVLLLDEPTNNLDPASREEILGALGTFTGALLLPDGDEDLWGPEYLELVALA